MFPDPQHVARLIREVADSEILPRFRRLAADESWEKRPGSVVTVADQAAENALAGALGDLVPGSLVVGEEAVEERPEILERLSGDAPVWVLDPVDGTSNFAAGKPDFAVIVAYVVEGETRAGWIHLPVEGVTAIAVAGDGAEVDGARARVAPAAPMAEMTGSLGPRLRRNKAFSGRFASVTNTKCCAVDYLAIVRGRIHFAYYRGLKPWDHAAGHLLHREAGGYSACLDGADYRPGAPGEGGLLLAPTTGVWRTLAADIPAALEAAS